MSKKGGSFKDETRPDYMPLVYVCSPYSGDVQRNVKNARKYCRFALERGAIPLAMHLLFPQFMDNDNLGEKDLALFMNYVVLGKCDELWVFGNQLTSGMQYEISLAWKRRMPIKFFTEGCKEVPE